MSKNYKNCENGHFYPSNLSTCPHCEGQRHDGTSAQLGNTALPEDTDKTALIGNGAKPIPGALNTNIAGGLTVGKTIPVGGSNSGNPGHGDGKTQVFPKGGIKEGEKAAKPSATRKLVGWLVSYTLSEFGIDFRLYEGQNIIGRDVSCSIRITEDPAISSKHATVLFRLGGFYLRDEMSTNPCFVNGEELLPGNTLKLNDGDSITIGETELFIREARVNKGKEA